MGKDVMAAIDSKPSPPTTELTSKAELRINLLDHARQAVRDGRKPFKFSPVSIEGEPLSQTILRNRGSY
ncbi:hypothetical protein AciX8_0431 [Granulicella mallensis MP5ACTX8]|uniref:Uncharacterized protein n=1 Tax=Granulicella mallensis (strain ATCC BAA-1857 / DSM 23137 / MP5ACTX8) TaxID=682795 RepID=G8NNJ9_GRAMM|nr:hypothetical protein AciX8_0431 [Granulicella mallensis MP5ACTX8]